MTQAFYAHMNNKIIKNKLKKKNIGIKMHLNISLQRTSAGLKLAMASCPLSYH
jgi:hypothetical protein